MESVIDLISAGFGAPVDRAGVANEGTLTSARTQAAMAQARERVAAAVKAEQINAARASFPTNGTPTFSDLLGADYGNADQASQGLLNLQTQSFRSSIADPAANRDLQLAQMEAVSGGPVARYYQPATGMVANQMQPTAAPTLTPVGQADIKANEALAAQRLAAPATSGIITRGSGVNQTISRDGGQTWQFAFDDPTAATRNSVTAGGTAMGRGGAGIELERPAAEAFVQGSRTKFEQTKSQLTQLVNDPALWAGVSVTQSLGKIPGTAGAAIRARIQALKSSLTQRALEEMRRASATGGAVGQVTEREWAWLADTFGAFNDNMSVQDFKEGLGGIAARLDQGMADTENQFALLYGRQATPNARWGAGGYQPPTSLPRIPAGTVPAAAPAAGGGLSPEEQAELDALRRAQGG